MFVKRAMNRKVFVANPDVTVKEAAKIMTQYRIGSLIVMEDKKIVGIITELDILWKVVAGGLDAETTQIKDVMTKDVITVQANQTVEEAAELMVENEVKKLPVLDDNKLVGIVTATDLISFQPKLIDALAKMLLFREDQTKVAG